ncbi:hypothetical protein FACS1894137_15340 [Spirochaetia bacterium]|nr:hypothetical protein FACS1894137_15340 [Spirochaetia bacterium]
MKDETLLSNFSPNLFWDIDLADLDMEKHAPYIVERVLDNGQMTDWVFIRMYYGMDKLRDIALKIRTMSPQSLAFISTVTFTPENKFRCYEQIHSKSTHWNY